jgi:hypothetical protein
MPTKGVGAGWVASSRLVGDPNALAVSEFVLTGVAQYAHECRATSPSAAVRNFIRIAVCLKSIH